MPKTERQAEQLHTDKNYITARDRIGDSLARRVAQNSAFPYDDKATSACACKHNCISKNNCACKNDRADQPQVASRSWGLEGYPLASMYAPLQNWCELYDEDAGFHRGTIFKELDLPFVCGERKGGNCRGK